MHAPQYEIFCDASFDPHLKFGVGAALLLSQSTAQELDNAVVALDETIQTQHFSADSCAALELLGVLWALERFARLSRNRFSNSVDERVCLTLYTDSQTIANLQARRLKLEASSFRSRRTGELLAHAELYQKFFTLTDSLARYIDLRLVWLKGHTPNAIRTREQEIFSTVDHTARTSLREERTRMSKP